MNTGLSLLDRASEVCGSDSELARSMGLHRVVIAELRAGKRTFTPETSAELAAIAGLDAREAAIDAIIERSKGTRRWLVLREILGKGLAAGVAAMWLLSYESSSNYDTATMTNDKEPVNSLYIVEYLTLVLCVIRVCYASLLEAKASNSRGSMFINKAIPAKTGAFA